MNLTTAFLINKEKLRRKKRGYFLVDEDNALQQEFTEGYFARMMVDVAAETLGCNGEKDAIKRVFQLSGSLFVGFLRFQHVVSDEDCKLCVQHLQEGLHLVIYLHLENHSHPHIFFLFVLLCCPARECKHTKNEL